MTYEPNDQHYYRLVVSQRGPQAGHYICIGVDKPHVKLWGDLYHCQMQGTFQFAAEAPRRAFHEWFNANTRGPYHATEEMHRYIVGREQWIRQQPPKLANAGRLIWPR